MACCVKNAHQRIGGGSRGRVSWSFLEWRTYLCIIDSNLWAVVISKVVPVSKDKPINASSRTIRWCTMFDQ